MLKTFICKKIIQLHNYIHRNDGATAIEYGLIVTLIAMAAYAAIERLGSQYVECKFDATAAVLEEGGGSTSCSG